MNLYCTLHEKITYVEDNDLRKTHEWNNGFCNFPLGYAFCPPPQGVFDDFVLYEDWSSWCKNAVPSPAELEESDNNALELERDFESSYG